MPNVLMGNHYHLLLETPEPNLVVGNEMVAGQRSESIILRLMNPPRGG